MPKRGEAANQIWGARAHSNVDLAPQTCQESGGMQAIPVPVCPDGAPRDPTRVQDRLNRRLQIVAGKGGVGRTTVACALAMRAARAGHRTLLLEVDAPDSAAALLGVKPAVDVPREVMNGLWLCRMSPPGSLREYALMVLRFKPLYSLVFENRLVKYLLRSIPSLGEFTMLGKAWFHTTEKTEDGAPRYERIIIDAPATGHAVTFLALARLVATVSPKGVMRQASERMADVLESSEHSCIHVVTLPEEMPVNEGVELVREGQHRLRMTLGLGFANRVLPALVRPQDQPTMARLNEVASPESQPYLRAASRRRDREIWQAEHIARFVDKTGLITLQLPDLGGAGVRAKQLDQIIAVFDAAEAQDG